MITLRFACQHVIDVSDDATETPRCPICGEARVQHVTAPAPRFTGACRGPHAMTFHVEPFHGKLGA